MIRLHQPHPPTAPAKPAPAAVVQAGFDTSGFSALILPDTELPVADIAATIPPNPSQGTSAPLALNPPPDAPVGRLHASQHPKNPHHFLFDTAILISPDPADPPLVSAAISPTEPAETPQPPQEGPLADCPDIARSEPVLLPEPALAAGPVTLSLSTPPMGHPPSDVPHQLAKPAVPSLANAAPARANATPQTAKPRPPVTALNNHPPQHSPIMPLADVAALIRPEAGIVNMTETATARTNPVRPYPVQPDASATATAAYPAYRPVISPNSLRQTLSDPLETIAPQSSHAVFRDALTIEAPDRPPAPIRPGAPAPPPHALIPTPDTPSGASLHPQDPPAQTRPTVQQLPQTSLGVGSHPLSQGTTNAPDPHATAALTDDISPMPPAATTSPAAHIATPPPVQPPDGIKQPLQKPQTSLGLVSVILSTPKPVPPPNPAAIDPTPLPAAPPPDVELATPAPADLPPKTPPELNDTAATQTLAINTPPPNPAAKPAPHPVPRTVAAAIITHAAHAGPDDKVELTLAPVELGRVRFALASVGDQLQVTLTVERPETLDLLRRHADDLRAEFRAAGYGESTLSFGHWGRGKPDEPSPQPKFAAPPAEQIPTPSPQPHLAGSGLNLRL